MDEGLASGGVRVCEYGDRVREAQYRQAFQISPSTPLEVAAQDELDGVVAVAAADEALGEIEDAAGGCQTAHGVAGQRPAGGGIGGVDVDVAADSHVLDADGVSHVIEVIQQLFEGRMPVGG